jgi:Amt family ammonium transporter
LRNQIIELFTTGLSIEEKMGHVLNSINESDIAWMLSATCLVFFMTPGLSFFYGGMVSKKNIISTMLQSFIALGVVSVLWVVVGFSLAFGDSIYGVIGDPRTFFMFNNVGALPSETLSPSIPLVLFAMFQLKFAIITPALITGSFAERIKFNGYLVFIILFTLFIYAPLAHMTWHPQGILRNIGVLDYAGGTVVHMSAGIAALTGAMFLGSRKNKVHITPVNIPFVILGTAMLWFGWFGFNAGSSLGANADATMAFATTNTASATGMIVWVMIDVVRGRKISALGACIGAVVGLVAITPAAGFVTIGHSLLIGAIASLVSYMAVKFKNRSEVDDTLDVFPTHGIGGMVGMILTAVFANEVGLAYGHWDTFIIHCIALIGICMFVMFMSLVLYRVTDKMMSIRVDEIAEEFGLDKSQHNEQYS